MLLWISVHPLASFSLQRFFFQAQFFPVPIGQGPFSLGSPVYGTMTAREPQVRRLLIVLPGRFFAYTLGTESLLLVCNALFLSLSPRSRRTAWTIYTRLPFGGVVTVKLTTSSV